jgi:16S rRNA A1518/A1519 N6-dimethyltransferase RsmA/KsgA/DIM1 with predicted DNA glycosylase/AP lyase activity
MLIKSELNAASFGSFDQELNGTTLSHVGHQLWSGSLLLGDFIHYMKEIWFDQEILEIGAGIGFLSVLCAKLGFKSVYATDIPIILDRLSKNVVNNQVQHVVKVRSLDLFDNDHPLWSASTHSVWSDVDLDKIRLVLVSDIIYDDQITCKFVMRLPQILENRTMYLSLEKRIVCTKLNGICAPAYDYFFHLISVYNECGADVICMEQIDTRNLPKCFKYNRTDQMELWKIYKKRKD